MLAFLAVFKVLIKDFFWMDMEGSLLFEFLSLLQTQTWYATGVPVYFGCDRTDGGKENQGLMGKKGRDRPAYRREKVKN